MSVRQLVLGYPPDPPSSFDRNSATNKYILELVDYLREIIGRLEEHSQETDRVTDDSYTTQNVTLDRDFDADTVAIAELADVVGTLIGDLRNGRWPK